MLGIGPGEFFLMLIILVVVVGPERLPGFARQAGKLLVGLRNWVQSSPDAQLFLRARDELETELRTIRNDLTQEVENVRLEMINVREEMIQATREATLDATRQIDGVTQMTSSTITTAQESLTSFPQPTTAVPIADAPEPISADELQRTIAPPLRIEPVPEIDLSTPQPVARSVKPNAVVAQSIIDQNQELSELRSQLQQLTTELRSMQEQIQELQANIRRGEPANNTEEPHEVTS